MVNSTDFGKRLQKILDFYGLSATAFSETLDFNRSTISHLLSGRNKPSLEFVMKVLHKFPEVELYWLLNGKGKFPKDLPSEKKEIKKPFLPSISTNEDAFQKELSNKIINDPSITSKRLMNTELSDIERIIIFYKDGSFKAYEN